jgi:alpha-L-fucosidase 2
MVFGGVEYERLQLNEDTLWAGGPYNPVNPEARAALPEVRRLLAAAQYRDAATLVRQKVMAKPLAQMPYQTLGDLYLKFAATDVAENYRRDLDLADAVAHVSYSSQGVTFAREVFASSPDQVIVVHLSANRPGQISFEARMQTPQRATVQATSDGDLVMRGVNGDGNGVTADGMPIPGALRFEARVRILPTGGTRSVTNDAVIVRNADAVTLLIAAATSYRSYNDVTGDPGALVANTLRRASRKTIDALHAEHVRDYRQFFDRVHFDLGQSNASTLPTDERIRAFAAGDDRALTVLYLQYARYLLLSSSRPGTQPANLQGIWNDSMNPPWGSKYTININTEMNYWPALPLNLAETMDPLTRMVEDLAVQEQRGKCMAQEDGWRITTRICGGQARQSTGPSGGCGQREARG